MTRPLRNLISAVTLAALTGLLVLAATQWTDVFFRFYPSFSRWILGVLAGAILTGIVQSSSACWPGSRALRPSRCGSRACA